MGFVCFSDVPCAALEYHMIHDLLYKTLYKFYSHRINCGKCVPFIDQ